MYRSRLMNIRCPPKARTSTGIVSFAMAANSLLSYFIATTFTEIFIDLLSTERILRFYNPRELSHQKYVHNDRRQKLSVGCKIYILF